MAGWELSAEGAALPARILHGSAAPSALSLVMLLSPARRGPTHCRPFWASPQTFQHRTAQVNLGTGPYMGSDWQSGGHGFDPRQLHHLILKHLHGLPSTSRVRWTRYLDTVFQSFRL